MERSSGRARGNKRVGLPKKLTTVTLDGSLLLGAQLPGAPARRSPQSADRRPKPSSNPATRPGRIYLDIGETEDTYIQTLRTHFVRNGTAETNLPMGRTARRYGAAGSPGPASALLGVRPSPGRIVGLVGGAGPPWRIPAVAGGAASPGKAALSSPGGALVQQEVALWEEREHELLDAQEARLAQLEDALRSREEKHEAYVVHRLEAAAADKVAVLARQRDAVARQKATLAQHAQHAKLDPRGRGQPAVPAAGTLPALPKAALRPLMPASPTLSAAVLEARRDLSSYSHVSNLESCLRSKQAFTASIHRGRQPQEGADEAAQRHTWAERKQETYSKQLDSVYSSMQALKSTLGRAAHPLDLLRVGRPLTSSQGEQPTRSGQSNSWEGGSQHPEVATNTAPGTQTAPTDQRALEAGAGTGLDGRSDDAGEGAAGGSGATEAASAQSEDDYASAGESNEEDEEPIEEVLLAHKKAASLSGISSHVPGSAIPASMEEEPWAEDPQPAAPGDESSSLEAERSSTGAEALPPEEAREADVVLPAAHSRTTAPSGKERAREAGAGPLPHQTASTSTLRLPMPHPGSAVADSAGLPAAPAAGGAEGSCPAGTVGAAGLPLQRASPVLAAQRGSEEAATSQGAEGPQSWGAEEAPSGSTTSRVSAEELHGQLHAATELHLLRLAASTLGSVRAQQPAVIVSTGLDPAAATVAGTAAASPGPPAGAAATDSAVDESCSGEVAMEVGAPEGASDAVPGAASQGESTCGSSIIVQLQPDEGEGGAGDSLSEEELYVELESVVQQELARLQSEAWPIVHDQVGSS